MNPVTETHAMDGRDCKFDQRTQTCPTCKRTLRDALEFTKAAEKRQARAARPPNWQRFWGALDVKKTNRVRLDYKLPGAATCTLEFTSTEQSTASSQALEATLRLKHKGAKDIRTFIDIGPSTPKPATPVPSAAADAREVA